MGNPVYHEYEDDVTLPSMLGEIKPLSPDASAIARLKSQFLVVMPPSTPPPTTLLPPIPGGEIGIGLLPVLPRLAEPLPPLIPRFSLQQQQPQHPTPDYSQRGQPLQRVHILRNRHFDSVLESRIFGQGHDRAHFPHRVPSATTAMHPTNLSWSFDELSDNLIVEQRRSSLPSAAIHPFDLAPAITYHQDSWDEEDRQYNPSSTSITVKVAAASLPIVAIEEQQHSTQPTECDQALRLVEYDRQTAIYQRNQDRETRHRTRQQQQEQYKQQLLARSLRIEEHQRQQLSLKDHPQEPQDLQPQQQLWSTPSSEVSSPTNSPTFLSDPW